ncbi:MAG: glucose-1-phosphate adenylyltransferase [Planctomycetaceae bacterium]
MKNVLTLILAGGRGTRLEPLTRERAKPAVPFGGAYRIIDFTLSNCLNSDLRRILVLTQYRAASLDRHLRHGWGFLHRELDEFIEVLPPQQRIDEQWYQGTADAVYQNIYTIEQHQAEYVLILSGDHIYKMDYSDLIRQHIKAAAVATIACLPVDLELSGQFGAIQVDGEMQITGFEEKPDRPAPLPDDPSRFLASMGVYVFNRDFLLDRLCDDATDRSSLHDFGKDIIPQLIGSEKVLAYPFRDRNSGQTNYWRDVGTLDAYYEASMDLIAVHPELDLYDQSWTLHTYYPPLPPPKTVFADFDSPKPRVGQAVDSIVCAGSIISGGRVEHSILGREVRINSWADVRDSILFSGVNVGRDAQIKGAIIEKNVQIPAGMKIGYDSQQDQKNGFSITESGIVTVPMDAFVS